MEKLHCARCGHEWYQRTPNRPSRCAGCKALYWDRPPRVVKVRIVGNIGAPIKYPFHNIDVGQSIKIPWPRLADGSLDAKKITSIHSCISSHARRSGKKFQHNQGTGLALTVTRLA